MDIVEFLNARLDEDEERVRVGPFSDKYHDTDDTLHGNGHAAGCSSIGCTDSNCYCGSSPCNCGANERLLAEVAAKRELLREIETITIYSTEAGFDPQFFERPAGRMLRAMAAPYVDHEDFDSEWWPE